MNLKRILFQTGMVIVLCLLIETISFFILRHRHQSVGFMLNLNGLNEVNAVKGFGFDEIDPLCGWAMSNKTLEGMGYKTEQNCEVLKSKGDFPAVPLKIFITGGSTSDIGLHKESWPAALHQLFEQRHINAIIYSGAVGGYSSGQELLKLMRDGLVIKPDVHISYSGANDYADRGYVSTYEQSFYQTAYRQSFTSAFLPAAVYLLKYELHLNYSGLTIKQTENMEAFPFWKQNMDVMSAIARQNNYGFIGILQPVLSIGNYHVQKSEDVDPGNYGKEYIKYFPQAQQYLHTGDTTLHDFTAIFDTATGKVYVDDCHLTEPYQAVVAENVYQLLFKGGYISNK